MICGVEQARVHIVSRQIGIFGEKEGFLRDTIGDGAHDILDGQPAASEPRPAAARVWRHDNLGSHETLAVVSARACHKEIRYEGVG